MYNTRLCFYYEHLTRILTTRSVFVAALCLLMVCGGFCEAAQRTQPIFMNEFAVRLSSGDAADADRIAAKHGFVNVGQIGSLPGYYLFRHNHVHRRSTTMSETHHSLLSSEPQVNLFIFFAMGCSSALNTMVLTREQAKQALAVAKNKRERYWQRIQVRHDLIPQLADPTILNQFKVRLAALDQTFLEFEAAQNKIVELNALVEEVDQIKDVLSV
ncbi:uncharacterized protein LOC113471140, partial [Diaphorina citri]|uniref:Uncharacterized protein LOC113471140 n=1 Tax=Diaphorina citri TaxID=121845 RepID=A0A3Q0JBQ0_DIACI